MDVFIEHYINIVEKSSGKKPLPLGNSSDASQDEMTVKKVTSAYSNHPSIRKIKHLCVPENKFDHPRDYEILGWCPAGTVLAQGGESASLALVGHPSSDGITIKMPYGVDVLHRPASHPIFSY